MRTKAFLSILLMGIVMLFTQCSDDFSCTDGEQNQGEIGIDCGGPCDTPCPSNTCFNGVQDADESGIDCGGPCPACAGTNPVVESCSDGIQNQDEEGVDCGGVCEACEDVVDPTGASFSCLIEGASFVAETVSGVEASGILNITGVLGTQIVTLTHIGAFQPGTYDVGVTAPASFADSGLGSSCVGTSGTIEFTSFSTADRMVSGTFSFECEDALAGSISSFTEGVFTDVSY